MFVKPKLSFCPAAPLKVNRASWAGIVVVTVTAGPPMAMVPASSSESDTLMLAVQVPAGSTTRL